MLKSPMLEAPTDTVETPAKSIRVTPTDTVETKATSLRRAATALLVFSMFCARPCPSSWGAWLGMISAVSVLCASGNQLLCRSRFARFVSVFVAVFAGYTVVSLIISYRAGSPVQMSNKLVLKPCVTMPADTFSWGSHKLVENPYSRNGLAFLSRYMHNGTAFLVSSASSDPAGATDPATWSQPEACDKLAHIFTRVAKMIMVVSALVHIALFFAAVAVVKRACCFRFAAYRAGLLTWKCCKGKCHRARARAKPEANVTPQQTAAKEVA